MKKNMVYIQTSILNEVMKEHTTREVADRMIDQLSTKDVELSVYETHDDAIVFRKKKDGTVTDESIIKSFMKAIRAIIDDSDDLEDAINDAYEFEYSPKQLTEGFFSDILEIRRAGRLISIEIDMQ